MGAAARANLCGGELFFGFLVREEEIIDNNNRAWLPGRKL
jgi:hypothetical protein